DLVDRARHVPQPRLVDGPGRAARPGEVAADAQLIVAGGQRADLGERSGELAVDVVAPLGTVEGDGDVGPDVARDDAAVAQRAGAHQVRPQGGLAADVALAEPPGLQIVLPGDAAAIVPGRRVGDGHP